MRPLCHLKADSYELRLMHAAAAEGCVQKILHFLSQLRQRNRLLQTHAAHVNQPWATTTAQKSLFLSTLFLQACSCIVGMQTRKAPTSILRFKRSLPTISVTDFATTATIVVLILIISVSHFKCKILPESNLVLPNFEIRLAFECETHSTKLLLANLLWSCYPIMFNNVPLHYLGTVGGKYRDFNILHLQSVLTRKNNKTL